LAVGLLQNTGLFSNERRPAAMTRLLVHVEGQTEEAFVKEVLAPHLYDIGYAEVSARLMGDERERDRRGGIRPWSEASRGIINRLRQDPIQVATTMVDYYGLPSVGSRGWPGRTEAGRLPFAERLPVLRTPSVLTWRN